VPAPALAAFVSRLPQQQGSFSLWAGPLTGPAVLEFQPYEPHYAASTMKLALVIAAYRRAERGHLDIDARIDVQNSFRSAADDSPFSLDQAEDEDQRVWQRLGTEVSLRWLCHRSIVRSSNLATNLVLDAVGMQAVAEVLQLAGAQDSCVTRGIEDSVARTAGMTNQVTAADLSGTLRSLVAGRLLSADCADEVLALLAAQQINDAVPAGLPPQTRVAHKSGWVEGISHDAAIISPDDAAPYVFVMCTTSDLPYGEATALIAAGAAASWADRRVLG
jgi:beta-lactamase class A